MCLGIAMGKYLLSQKDLFLGVFCFRTIADGAIAFFPKEFG